MILALTSDTISRGEMYDAASTILAQKISQIDGVGDVTVGGGALPAVRVEIDPGETAAQGISLDTVRTAIRNAMRIGQRASSTTAIIAGRSAQTIRR